jgi:DNA-binding PadR family transcriptional regulator
MVDKCAINYPNWIYLLWIDLHLLKDTKMPTARPINETPLKPAVFHILLALSDNPHHGLGIADRVEHATGGAIRLGPGTLYRSLKEMTRDGFVEEIPTPAEDEDPRRKFHRITEAGRVVLEAEAARYQRIVEVAKERRVLPEAR